MADYISREAVLSAIWKTSAKHNVFFPAIMLDAIKAIPAADVRPVVKARWVYTNMSRLVCSNCGNPVAFSLKEDGWHHGDYCPNCGAMMEES